MKRTRQGVRDLDSIGPRPKRERKPGYIPHQCSFLDARRVEDRYLERTDYICNICRKIFATDYWCEDSDYLLR